MAVIKLGDLTTFTGDTSGSYLVINDSTNTTTYKVQKEQLLSGSFAGTASFADNAATASFALTASFLTGDVVSASYARSASYAIINESQYRFENQTTLDQDIWLSNEVITKIVKSAGVNTAEYRTGSAAYNSITFTGDTFTGQIPVTASDVFSWRITYNSGYTSAALIVLHSKV